MFPINIKKFLNPTLYTESERSVLGVGWASWSTWLVSGIIVAELALFIEACIWYPTPKNMVNPTLHGAEGT